MNEQRFRRFAVLLLVELGFDRFVAVEAEYYLRLG